MAVMMTMTLTGDPLNMNRTMRLTSAAALASAAATGEASPAGRLATAVATPWLLFRFAEARGEAGALPAALALGAGLAFLALALARSRPRRRPWIGLPVLAAAPLVIAVLGRQLL